MQDVEQSGRQHGYMIMEWLGSGAMGDVYKCLDQNTGQLVALKWLRRLDLIKRFNTEARILSSLHHPNIARFINYVYTKDYAFIVMEYVEGITLDRLLNHQGKLPEAYALRLMKQMAGAIKYLHEHQVIHRDLKAANIKLKKDSTIKILDFGVSKAVWSEKLTAEGFFIGSMSHIAPEQFKGTISEKIDSWALGVIFYQMITRYLPFTSDNDSILRLVIEKGKYIKPEIFDPRLTNRGKTIIRYLLAKNPQKRWSIDELIGYLDASERNPKNENLLTVLKNWLGSN